MTQILNRGTQKFRFFLYLLKWPDTLQSTPLHSICPANAYSIISHFIYVLVQC